MRDISWAGTTSMRRGLIVSMQLREKTNFTHIQANLALDRPAGMALVEKAAILTCRTQRTIGCHGRSDRLHSLAATTVEAWGKSVAFSVHAAERDTVQPELRSECRDLRSLGVFAKLIAHSTEQDSRAR